MGVRVSMLTVPTLQADVNILRAIATTLKKRLSAIDGGGKGITFENFITARTFETL